MKQQRSVPGSPSLTTPILVALALGLALLDTVLAFPRRPDAPTAPAVHRIAASPSCSEPPALQEIQDMLGHD